ncbi:centromere/kinetochore protein zw10 homolog isoform X1 [Stegodyphus dumicola]|uniref:centromere/kinetochore protein zw10 homolog isoform X1 n=2 Tax=Stegodyphus dumicola TaxID=202533 RepID=UPI0015A8EFB4|nr:centromere/kinetochore protein zw10 homolog isoform X1 [Stegodyphus dumicola]
MTSVVTELLQSAGKLNRETIELKINDLKTKLETIKQEVQHSLENQYKDFIPQYLKLDDIIKNLDKISSRYEALHNHIEKELKPQMVSSVTEFHDVVEDLKRAKKLEIIASNLILLYQYLDKEKSALLQTSYVNAAQYLIDFENVYNSVDLENRADIAVLHSLRTEFILARENLIYHLGKVWQQKLVISWFEEGNDRKVVFTIHKNAHEDKELFRALKLLNNLLPLLKQFGKLFLNMICDTVLLNTIKIEKSEMSSVLTINIISVQSPTPVKVFEALSCIFNFLYEEFFHLPNTAVENTHSSSTMNDFGMAIGDDFCSLVIEKCLKSAIPKQSNQLENFRKEIQAAENFCNTLKQLEFFSMSENKLLNFIHNVDTLPVNKMAQDILSRARLLMRKGLHETMTIGEESAAVLENENSHDLNEIARTKSGLSKTTFLFPKCQISVSVKELQNLLYEVKNEAKIIGSVHSVRLYYVARNICELYCCVVPTFHKDEIENIPLQTAIFHNNCMYLAHCLCTLGNHYKCDLTPNIPMTFIDLVPEIRKLGTEAFLFQMRHQRQQLLQLLKEQKDYQSIMVDDGLVNKAEKAIRQCLCQLQLLKKVWSDVLPVEVYFKAIGTLLNTCLEEIIANILLIEDIAAEAAAKLDSIFDILLKEGPDLFKVSSIDKSNLIHLYVRSLFKFQELQLIFSASMKEIVDRWASGKGPLATHFKSEEVKHLIRSLFQNTERRAAALAKIK